MEKRICTICLLIKSFNEFHWDKRFNIPFSRCKKCYNKRCSLYRKSDKGKATYDKWMIQGQGRIVRRRATEKWEALHPQQKSAIIAVNNAVRDGKLLRRPCEVCNNPKSEGHHTSYDKNDWLKVIWLCKFHHVQKTFPSCLD